MGRAGNLQSVWGSVMCVVSVIYWSKRREPHLSVCLDAYLPHRHLVYAGIECGFPCAQNFGAPNILATGHSAFRQRNSHFLQLSA